MQARDTMELERVSKIPCNEIIMASNFNLIIGKRNILLEIPRIVKKLSKLSRHDQKIFHCSETG